MHASSHVRVHALIDSLTWGGAESLLADLAAGVPSVGVSLTVGYLQDVDGSPSAARLRARGVEPELVGVRRLADVESVRRVRRQLERVRPDVVHTHLGAADVQGALAARSLGLPAVSTIHLIGRQPAGGPRREALKEHLMAFARRHGTGRVIAVSEAARRAYLETGWDRPDHVVTVHNGIALAAPRVGREAVRAGLGIPADAPLVSMITVLRPGKGHEVAVEAVRGLLPRFPGLRLLVVGDGPSREHVERLVAPLGAAAQVLGHRDDVIDILGATDVLLLPTDRDAFPTVLLEAAGMGVPAVATAVGGIPEIVADGETGILVDAPARADAVAAALERLLGDDALRERLAAAARRRFAAWFSAERWAERLRGVYDTVLAEHRARR